MGVCVGVCVFICVCFYMCFLCVLLLCVRVGEIACWLVYSFFHQNQYPSISVFSSSVQVKKTKYVDERFKKDIRTQQELTASFHPDLGFDPNMYEFDSFKLNHVESASVDFSRDPNVKSKFVPAAPPKNLQSLQSAFDDESGEEKLSTFRFIPDAVPAALQSSFKEVAGYLSTRRYRTIVFGATAQHTLDGQNKKILDDVSVGVAELLSPKKAYEIGSILSLKKPSTVMGDLGCSVGNVLIASSFCKNIIKLIGVEYGNENIHNGKLACFRDTLDHPSWSQSTRDVLQKVEFYEGNLNFSECYDKLKEVNAFFLADKIFRQSTRDMVWKQLTQMKDHGIRVLTMTQPRYMEPELRKTFKYRGQIKLQYIVYAYSTEQGVVDVVDQTILFQSW